MKGLFVLLLAVLTLVQATHFRYGTLTWTVPDFDNKPNEVQLSLSVIMRSGYYNPADIYVNNSVPIYVVSDSTVQFYFGDGTTAKPVGVITNVQADSFQAVWTVLHAYPMSSTPKNYTSYFDSRARLDALNNNAGKHYRVGTFITLFGATKNTSPRSSSAAIRQFQQNGIRVIDVQAVDDESPVSALNFQLATPTQMGDTSATQPPGLSVLPNKTVIWNTTGVALGLWNTQIRFTDPKGAYSVIDFLLNLTEQTIRIPPVFVAPSPANGFVLQVKVGLTIEFDIAANSTYTDDVLTIEPSLPSFCTITTVSSGSFILRHVVCLPTSNLFLGQNPASFTLSPGGATTGVIIEVLVGPTAMPSTPPTAIPSMAPSAMPTAEPTMSPTAMPTAEPTIPPTAMPTAMPSAAPSAAPSVAPTVAPTAVPATMTPTAGPFCGDNTCQASENCDTCEADCGDCPMVIWSELKAGYVVTAAAASAASAVILTPYNITMVPTALQAWKYNAITKLITLRATPGLLLGAGPIANSKNVTFPEPTWDFKGTVQDASMEATSGKMINQFKFVNVSATSPWKYITNVQWPKHSLKAPYQAKDEVWGYAKTENYPSQHFQWGRHICHSC